MDSLFASIIASRDTCDNDNFIFASSPTEPSLRHAARAADCFVSANAHLGLTAQPLANLSTTCAPYYERGAFDCAQHDFTFVSPSIASYIYDD